MLSIEQESPDQPDAARLLEQADVQSASLYPAESRHGLSVTEMLSQGVRFFVARLDGRAVGCGGYSVGPDGTAEVKRIFVLPEARGRGVGQAIVLAVEQAANGEHVRCLRLETGIKSAEALRMYRRLGYVERDPFGTYRPDASSVFMEKTLSRA